MNYVEEQTIVVIYSVVMVIVFAGCALAVDDRSIPLRTRRWIGRAGLAAPLWPVVAAVAIVVLLVVMGRRMYKVAREKR